MKKVLFSGLLLGVFLYCGSALAVSFSIDTVRSIGSDGKSIIGVASIIKIAGLGDRTAPSLGAFDLNFMYDPNILDLQFVQLGPGGLGDPDQRVVFFESPSRAPVLGAGESIADASEVSQGQINIFNISLLESDAATCIFCIGPFLDDLQSSEFILTALSFDVKPDVFTTTALGLSVNSLSDGFGNVLTPDASGVTTFVSTAPIPEPSTILLLGSGVIGLMGLRWNKSRANHKCDS